MRRDARVIAEVDPQGRNSGRRGCAAPMLEEGTEPYEAREEGGPHPGDAREFRKANKGKERASISGYAFRSFFCTFFKLSFRKYSILLESTQLLLLFFWGAFINFRNYKNPTTMATRSQKAMFIVPLGTLVLNTGCHLVRR